MYAPSLTPCSDRGFGPERAPVSSLLALGCVHHHLVHLKLRSKVGLFVESGEPRELHQVSCALTPSPLPGHLSVKSSLAGLVEWAMYSRFGGHPSLSLGFLVLLTFGWWFDGWAPTVQL